MTSLVQGIFLPCHWCPDLLPNPLESLELDLQKGIVTLVDGMPGDYVQRIISPREHKMIKKNLLLDFFEQITDLHANITAAILIWLQLKMIVGVMQGRNHVDLLNCWDCLQTTEQPNSSY